MPIIPGFAGVDLRRPAELEDDTFDPASLRFLIAVELLARLDVWVLSDALLVLTNERQDKFEHPPVIHFVGEEGVPLVGVATEIEDHRKLRGDDRLFDALAIAKPNFDVVPLDRHQGAVGTEEQERIAARVLAFADQEPGG